MARTADPQTASPQTASPQPRSRETRSRENSRRRLVEAAREAFAERGIRDTPVELICERAGFTRGAFYSNFASKEDLFLAVYEEVSARITEKFVTAVGAPPAVHEPDALRTSLQTIAARYVSLYVVDESWFVLMAEIRLLALRQPELRPRVRAVTEQTVAALVEVIAQFLAATGVRLAVSATEVAQLLVALHDHSLTSNLLAGRPLEEEHTLLTTVVPRMLVGLVDWSGS